LEQKLQPRLRLAAMLRQPEPAFEADVLRLESDPVFELLRIAGVVTFAPFPGGRFAQRRLEGRSLCCDAPDLPDLIAGQGELVRLIQAVGQERFKRYFLDDAGLSEEAVAGLCGITIDATRRLRDFADRVAVRAELEPEPQQSAARVFST